MRMTTERVPATLNQARDTGIPLAILVKPYGELPSEEPVPCATFGQNAIVRCHYCRAYVNPFVKFKQNGVEWECNFCHSMNKTESHYYSPTDQAKIILFLNFGARRN
jgi:protein transport protein SEC24